jgi:hypothetical protein
MITLQYKGQMILIKRILPSGSRAATLAEHRVRKQALGMTRKSDRDRPPGVRGGRGVLGGFNSR